jgi:hypothetical protein
VGRVEDSALQRITQTSTEGSFRHPALSIASQALWHADVTASCEQLSAHVASDPPPLLAPPAPDLATEPPQAAPSVTESAKTAMESEHAIAERSDIE